MPFQRRTAVHLFPHVALALFILGSAHAALAQNVTIQARLEYALPYACGVFPDGGPFLPALPFNPNVLPNVPSGVRLIEFATVQKVIHQYLLLVRNPNNIPITFSRRFVAAGNGLLGPAGVFPLSPQGTVTPRIAVTVPPHQSLVIATCNMPPQLLGLPPGASVPGLGFMDVETPGALEVFAFYWVGAGNVLEVGKDERLLAANILLVNKITFRLRGPAGRLPPLVPLVAVAVKESECCENPAADSLDEGKLPSIAPQTLPGGILDPVSEVAEEIEREIGQPVNRDLIEVLEVDVGVGKGLGLGTGLGVGLGSGLGLDMKILEGKGRAIIRTIMAKVP